MRRAIGAMHAYDGKQFNDDVADHFATIDGFVVRRRVKSFNKKRLRRANGEDLGDVDVLLAIPWRRELVPVETKNLTAALTPPELSNELAELFGGASQSGHIGKFSERVQWIKALQKDVLIEMKVKIGKLDSWTVNPMAHSQLKRNGEVLAENFAWCSIAEAFPRSVVE
jgi:hypothetical protein